MKIISKLSKPILYSLFGVYLILLGLSGCLFLENQAYTKMNRELIIVNDSIMSVNIELNKTLKKKYPSSIKKSPTASLKTHYPE